MRVNCPGSEWFLKRMVWGQTVLGVNGPLGERYGVNCPGSERSSGRMVWGRIVLGVNGPGGEWYGNKLSWK